MASVVDEWDWSVGGMILTGEKLNRTWRKPCLIATLSTTKFCGLAWDDRILASAARARRRTCLDHGMIAVLMLYFLTLRLLMSYIYGAPSKTRNANVYIYGPTFGNAETVSFYLLHNVSTLNQCREVSCVTFVCKHFAS